MGWFTFGDALGAANLAAGLFGANSANKQAKQAAAEMAAIRQQAEQEQARVRGIVDDLSAEGPMFQNAYSDKRGILDRDFQQNLAALERRNNRAISRTGGVGFITPERSDEFFSSALLRNQMDLRARAREEARNVLLTQAGLANANANSVRANAQTVNQGAMWGNQANNALYGGISGALYGLNALANRGGFGSRPVSNLWESATRSPMVSTAGGYSGYRFNPEGR